MTNPQKTEAIITQTVSPSKKIFSFENIVDILRSANRRPTMPVTFLPVWLLNSKMTIYQRPKIRAFSSVREDVKARQTYVDMKAKVRIKPISTKISKVLSAMIFSTIVSDAIPIHIPHHAMNWLFMCACNFKTLKNALMFKFRVAVGSISFNCLVIEIFSIHSTWQLTFSLLSHLDLGKIIALFVR